MSNSLAQRKIKTNNWIMQSTNEFQAQHLMFLNPEQLAPVPRKMALFFHDRKMPKTYKITTETLLGFCAQTWST
jgi:hypothetical protein